MRFVYPLGLLGLIGIPVLIIIYIIKNKYTEQTVTSTYLWTLSERFLKRKNPISKLAGLIALILQILAVALISFGIAHPYFVLPDSAHEYCFILDASGSMNFEKDGVTCFEKGKQTIGAYIEQASDGSQFTLVCVSNTASVVYEAIDDKRQALHLLEQATPMHVEADFEGALEVAQRRFDDNTSLRTYLITDNDYQDTNNVTVVNVGYDADNFSVEDFSFSEAQDGKTVISGKVYSAKRAVTLTLDLYVNGEDIYKTLSLQVPQGERVAFSDEYQGEVQWAKAVVRDRDALGLDNVATYYSKDKQQEKDILIVSKQPFFLQSAFHAVGFTSTTVIEPQAYSGEGEYDMYVFDGYTPDEMPRYGVVWLLALDSDLDKAGFSIYGSVDLLEGGKIEISTSSNSEVKALTENLTGSNVYINKYRKYGALQTGCKFKTVYEYKSSPMVFMGQNEYGNKQVVFAFDLHDSNFPLTADYTILTYNLLNASFPQVLEKTAYDCGETLQMNVPADCRHVEIVTPAGEVELRSPRTVANYALTQAGTYTITLKTATQTQAYSVSARLPKSEKLQNQTQAFVGVHGTATDGGMDGKWDNLLYFFIALGLFFVADWVVYCYDKYQLR